MQDQPHRPALVDRERQRRERRYARAVDGWLASRILTGARARRSAKRELRPRRDETRP